MKPQDEALSVLRAIVASRKVEAVDLPVLNGLIDRLSHSTPGDAEVRKATEELAAFATLLERPPLDDVEIEAKLSVRIAASIRTLLATPSGRAQAWLPIKDAPRDGTEIVAAIKVRHIKGGMWWERHVIAADEETGELHPDYDHGWAFDDYELWMPLADLPELPAAPPAQDQTKGVEP